MSSSRLQEFQRMVAGVTSEERNQLMQALEPYQGEQGSAPVAAVAEYNANPVLAVAGHNATPVPERNTKKRKLDYDEPPATAPSHPKSWAPTPKGCGFSVGSSDSPETICHNKEETNRRHAILCLPLLSAQHSSRRRPNKTLTKDPLEIVGYKISIDGKIERSKYLDMKIQRQHDAMAEIQREETKLEEADLEFRMDLNKWYQAWYRWQTGVAIMDEHLDALTEELINQKQKYHSEKQQKRQEALDEKRAYTERDLHLYEIQKSLVDDNRRLEEDMFKLYLASSRGADLA